MYSITQPYKSRDVLAQPQLRADIVSNLKKKKTEFEGNETSHQ